MKNDLTPEEKERAFKAQRRSTHKFNELKALEMFDELNRDVKKANDDHNKMRRLVEQQYVRIREKLNILAVCCILQETAELYGCCEEAKGAYWVPSWFFMAVWPAAKKGNKTKAEERAYRVTFDHRYRKAMETKYAIVRKLEVDNNHTGVWE